MRMFLMHAVPPTDIQGLGPTWFSLWLPFDLSAGGADHESAYYSSTHGPAHALNTHRGRVHAPHINWSLAHL